LNKLFIYNYEGTTDTSEYISRKHNKFIEWSECLFNSYRNFDNLFFDNKEVLIQKLDFFINNKEWYIKEGHPYTLGIGLSGSPGTGKTSIIKSIANKLKRHLIVISLSKIKTIRELSDCFFENQYSSKNKEGSIGFDKKIIVFEDIDCMCDIVYDRNIQKEALKPDIDKSDNMSTKDIVDAVVKGIKQDEIDFIEKSTTKKEDDKLTLSFVLNLIDGIRETPGRIMILTSNYYNKLDKALVRPGRIDITLELKNASRKTICDIYKHYYQEDIPQNILIRLKDNVLSPAELVNIKLNSYNNNDYLKKLSEKFDSIDDF
jgi:chaperone BCS1